MEKKLVIIGAAAILLIGAVMFLISAFIFGMGGASYKSYDSSNSGSKSPYVNEISSYSQDAGSGNLEESILFERKIIFTANLQIEVSNVQTALNNISAIATGYGGYTSGSSISGYGERKSGNIVIRVPQEKFYVAIEQIEGLGSVKSRSLTGQDVTEEYIDINARLVNLQKQEDRLSEILEMANTVEGVLQVERELERVRSDIERLTGRKNYLEKSIEMSTITVNANDPAPFFEGLGITNAVKEAVNGFFNTIIGLIVFTGYVIPIAIYLLVAILVWMGIKRKVLPRLFGEQ